MDTKKVFSWGKDTSGLLSLEASIALTIFLFLMLFLYSFLAVFEARNQIGHVLLTTSDSLALDAFSTETLKDDSSLQGVLYGLYGRMVDSNGSFTDHSAWYKEEDISDAVEARFLAYLSGGDRAEADKILRGLNVVGGVDGLDFSHCKVSKGDLYLEVRYQLQYEFQVFGLGKLSFSQSCCSKLWNKEGK